MEIQSGPNAIDEPSLLYKLQRKIKVFNTNNALPNRGYNLVACTSRYGLVFVASPNAVLSVYYLKELIDKECEPQHLSVNLQIQPTHIAVNCNQEWLAVIGGQMLVVYKCMDFQNPDIRPTVTIKCDVNPSTFVSALQWNPCIPDTIGIIYFDGTLLVSQVSTMQVKKIQSNARCLCWSPKGKQVVTGNNDGTLTQYKPDLSPMKMVPAPNLFEGSPLEALAIYWIATYQFAVAYRNSSNNSRPAVTIVNTPKAGTPICYNYDDICYSMGSNRPWYYYLQGIAQWNIILSSSSNSMEIATLSSTDGSNWIQWCQTDEARPELPLTDKKQENYPVGICIDTVAIHQLPWGENETLPPMPLLHVVSQTGLLSIFNIINLNKSASQICTALQPLALPAAALTRNIPDDVPSQPEPPPAVVQPKPQQQTVIQQPQQQAIMQQQQQQAMMQQQQQQAMMQQQQQAMMQQQQQAVMQQQQQQAMMQQQQQQAMIQQQQAMMQHQQSMIQQQQQSIAQQQQQQSIVQQQQSVVQPQPIASDSQRQKTIIAPVKTIPQQQSNLSSVPAATKESSSAVVESSITGPQPKPTVQVPKPRVPSAEVSAALKAEQEKINKAKANEELKNMLIKEVNDFQMELYNFMKLSQEKREKFQQDIQSINLNAEINMDTELLRKECEIDELRESVTQLKLELVRACAVVAEARTQAEANCRHEWTQMDPLTAKRISSVKKLAYYVQTQLDQALKALDHRWNEMAARDTYAKPGERMIRPILDDVYQPLVKQQEILSRQQAELKTLRNAMNDCNFTPMFRSTTLLRSTPFRNKDPLSKLTKNILNMNIEPKNKAKEQLLNSQKLDALRDVLSNHKPRKVKPVNVELTQHLETMKQRYVKSLKEKEEKKELEQAALKVEAKEELEMQTEIKQEKPLATFSKPQLPSFSQTSIKTENLKPATSNMQSYTQKLTNLPPSKNDANIFSSQKAGASFAYDFGQSPAMEPKPDIVKESPAVTPSYTPVTLNVKPTKPASVVRTLFTDDANENLVETIQKPQAQALQVRNKPPKQMTNQETMAKLRNIILKDMEQNICSPTAFNFSKPSATAPAAVFPSKPITDMTTTFNKLQHRTTEPTVSSAVNPKSDETGESELSKDKVKEEKPITNMFSLKTTTPLNRKNQNVPDVLKSNSQGFVFGTTENKSIANEGEEKSKENVPDKPKEPKQVLENKNDNETKPLLAPVTTTKAPAQSVIIVDLKKPAAEAKVEKVPSSIFSGAPVSPPPTVSKPQSELVRLQQPVVEISLSSTTPVNLSKPVTVTTTASKTVVEQTVEQSNSTSSNDNVAKPSVVSESKEDSKVEINKKDNVAPNIVFEQTIEQSNNTSLNDKVAKPSEIAESKHDSKVEISKQDNVAPNVGASVFSSTNTGTAFNTSLNTTSTAAVITSESKPSVFSTATPSSIFSSTPQVFTSQPPVFASNASSVFATASAAAFGPQTTQSSIFGTASSTSSAFGTTTTTSIFGGTSSAQSIFSSGASKSIFGTTSASTSQSIFGTTPTTTQTSVFGTNQSVFGTSTSNSGFGATTQASIFGSPSKQTSIFGSPTQTTQTSVFGTPTQTTQASVFGTPTQTTQASVFGTPTQTTQASVFGTPTQTTQASVFGTPTQTTQASVFGTPTQTTQASVFGTPTQTTQASVFGTPTQTTQASIFGTPTTTTQSGSLFGNAESNLFAAASISTTSGPSQASGGNIFGSSSGSVFGSSNTSVFGSKTGFAGSNPTATNIFGGSAAFGQKPATDFWSGGSNTTTFGSSGFGQQAKTQSSSIFGTSGGSFSAPSTGQPFGNPGPFSGGESKSVFGSPQQQSAPGAFGSSPVFASKPVFGGSSGFGSSAFGGLNKSPNSGFGAPASFGGTAFGGNAFGNTSPNKVFGNSSPNFGNPIQSNATFENLATQNTLTFGNLAQQSGQAPQAAPSFNTSPSFTGWRG